MIPFQRADEPANFDERVRKPGHEYLESLKAQDIKISSKHFTTTRSYWLRVRQDLKEAFQSICAYSGMFVSDSGEVDHFKAKSDFPYEAYEWTNYRFVCSDINKRKSNAPPAEILDPFDVQPGWFFVHIPTFTLEIAPDVPEPYKSTALKTINDHLRLNDESWKKSRQEWLQGYLMMEEIPARFVHELKKKVPLLADALEKFCQQTGQPQIVD